MPTTVAGFVLRAMNRENNARFYSALGLDVREHQHGGPVHHEVGPMSDECVLELYARSTAFSQDALMLNVDSIDSALRAVAKFNVQATTEARDMDDARFIYIRDPDGRPVMLIEKK